MHVHAKVTTNIILQINCTNWWVGDTIYSTWQRPRNVEREPAPHLWWLHHNSVILRHVYPLTVHWIRWTWSRNHKYYTKRLCNRHRYFFNIISLSLSLPSLPPSLSLSLISMIHCTCPVVCKILDMVWQSCMAEYLINTIINHLHTQYTKTAIL